MLLNLASPEIAEIKSVTMIVESSPQDAYSYRVAIDPNTNSELLEKLAENQNAKVREAVTSNPNTPANILLKLGAEFPSQLLANPIFTLLLLEKPNLVSEIPLETLRSLVSQEDIPLSVLVECAELYSDEEMQLRMTMNPNLPANIVGKLMQSKNSDISEAASFHINRVADTGANWDQIAQTAIAKIARSITRPTNIQDWLSPLKALTTVGAVPMLIFMEWQQSWQGKEMAYIAGRSPNTAPKTLELLALWDDAKLNLLIAENPLTPIAVLEKFAQSDDLQLKIAIAKNPHTSASILEKLANTEAPRDAIADKLHQQSRVMQQQYRHKGATDLISDFLPMLFTSVAAQTTSPDTHRTDLLELALAVAAHPNTPTHVLEDMAWDERSHNYTQIRHVAISNPNFPLALLKQLSRGGDERTIRACAENPKMPTEDLERIANYGERWLTAVITNPNAPLKILEQVAQLSNSYKHTLIAQNPATPLYLLKQLAQEPKNHLWIAKNPTADADVLTYIASITQDNNVHLAIAAHPRTPASVLESISSARKPAYYLNGQFFKEMPTQAQGFSQNPHLPETIGRDIIHSECDTRTDFPKILPQVIAHNPKLLVSVLEHYSTSTWLLVRVIVLLNPQVPVSCLETASRSLYWIERYIAAKHSNTPNSIREILTRDANRVVCASAKSTLQHIVHVG